MAFFKMLLYPCTLFYQFLVQGRRAAGKVEEGSQPSPRASLLLGKKKNVHIYKSIYHDTIVFGVKYLQHRKLDVANLGSTGIRSMTLKLTAIDLGTLLILDFGDVQFSSDPMFTVRYLIVDTTGRFC
ncbi:hypothetical protein QAD02_020829 [Eretmocerus hayati]|uniref:Uncharacterized protein n=1 Tax=Eretmocerus hayati TaxID=131215 RepID=A0ACC2PPT4_9HYME|nr:hypothetical protein QAD02_020829 [Eretmocerus hayati]